MYRKTCIKTFNLTILLLGGSMNNEYDLLDKVFEYREGEFLENISDDFNLLKNKVKHVKKEEIDRLISNLPEEYNLLKEQLTSNIEDLIIDYNITMAYYNKKYYKQGFKDATNLINICK